MAGVSILRSFSQSPVAIRKYLRLYKESLFWLMILEAGKSNSICLASGGSLDVEGQGGGGNRCKT
jgi:hypothetical protein